VILIAGVAFAEAGPNANLVTAAERIEETRTKEGRLGALMAARGLDGILLTGAGNQAWILAGTDIRGSRKEAGSAAWLLLARGGKKFLVADNVEGPRIMAEAGLQASGWTERRFPWFAGSASGRDERRRIVDGLLPGGRIGSDIPLAGFENAADDLARARFPLTTGEMRRMRWLGARAGAAVAQVCREFPAGMRETEIRGLLEAKLARDGIRPVAVLVGSDGRLLAWRRPPATEAKAGRLVLVGLAAERWGLIVASSRLVHFGAVPADVESRMKVVAAVAAAYLKAARPGATLGQVLAEGAEAYAASGWAEEWRNDSQGGAIAYAERELPIGPESREGVVEGMAVAFSPSLPGIRVEDTILVGPHGAETLTHAAGWPVRRVAYAGAVWEVPDILVRTSTVAGR
jgi:antitoxin VapB